MVLCRKMLLEKEKEGVGEEEDNVDEVSMIDESSPLAIQSSDKEPGCEDNSAPFNQYIEADIILKDAKCKNCSNDVDIKKEAVECFKCKNLFHAVCYKDSRDVGSQSAVSGHLIPATTNTGTYAKRFGRFIFLCDFCMTTVETNACVVFPELSTNAEAHLHGNSLLRSKVDNLTTDVSQMKHEIREEIDSLRELISQSVQGQQLLNQKLFLM